MRMKRLLCGILATATALLCGGCSESNGESALLSDCKTATTAMVCFSWNDRHSISGLPPEIEWDAEYDDGTVFNVGLEEKSYSNSNGDVVAEVIITDKDYDHTICLNLLDLNGVFSFSYCHLQNELYPDITIDLYDPDGNLAEEIANPECDSYRSYTGVWMFTIGNLDHGEFTPATDYPLADGEYSVRIYPDGTKMASGKTAETFDLLGYEKFPDEVIQSLKIGDVVPLHEHPFTVESMEYSYNEYGEFYYFNNYLYHCKYNPETLAWTFYGDGDIPLSYVVGQYTLPADGAVIIDEMTPIYADGYNVYGETVGKDIVTGEDEKFAINALADYFECYDKRTAEIVATWGGVGDYHLDWEMAYITVKNGAIRKILIPFHP